MEHHKKLLAEFYTGRRDDYSRRTHSLSVLPPDISSSLLIFNKENMTSKQMKILYQASKILHKEFDKYKCKSFDTFCYICRSLRIIEEFDDLIELLDDSKWSELK